MMALLVVGYWLLVVGKKAQRKLKTQNCTLTPTEDTVRGYRGKSWDTAENKERQYGSANTARGTPFWFMVYD